MEIRRVFIHSSNLLLVYLYNSGNQTARKLLDKPGIINDDPMMTTKLPPVGVVESAPNNLLRSDWSFASVTTNARITTTTNKPQPFGSPSTKKTSSNQYDDRPGSKERYGNNKKKGLPPVYSKWLIKYWLYSNRTQTCPVDHVNLSGWPIDKVLAGCVSTICKRALSLTLIKSMGVTDQILNRLSFLSKIRLLDISGCNEVTDDGIHIIRRHFPKLRKITLSNLTQITRLSVSPMIKTFKNMREYNFSGCTELTDAVLESLTFCASRPDEYELLETLDISRCVKFTAAGLGPFLQQCHTLIEFKLRSCINIEGIGFAPLQEQKQLSLFVLDLGGMPQIQDVDFAWICAGVPHCQQLWLDEMTLLTDKSMKRLIHDLPELQVLSLKGCTRITDQTLLTMAGYSSDHASMSSFKKSRKKTKKSNQEEEDDTPETTRMKMNEHLDNEWNRAMVTIQRNIEEEAMAAAHKAAATTTSTTSTTSTTPPSTRNSTTRPLLPPETPDARPLSQLTELNITDAKRLTLNAVSILVSHCPLLVRLKISQVVAGVSHRDKNFAKLINVKSFMSQLTHLNLLNCGGLTERSLTHIAKKCGALKELDLTGCMQMNDTVLQHLGMCKIARKRKLQKLILMNCKEITNAGISMLVSTGNMKTLEVLNLKSCVHLTDDALFALSNTASSQGLSSLHTLILSGIQNLTDHGIISIARHCKKILKLDLGGCHRITPFALDALPQIIPLGQTPARRKGLEPRGTSVRSCLSRLIRESRAAVQLQRRYKIRLMSKESFRKKEEERLRVVTEQKENSTRIQAWWRGMLTRVSGGSSDQAKRMHRRRLVRGYAKKAQSIVRMYLAKLRVQIRREHVNANHIQRVWRGKLGRQKAYIVLCQARALQFFKRLKNKKMTQCFNRWVEQIDKLLRCRVLVKKCFGSIKMTRFDSWKLFINIRRYIKHKCSKKIALQWKSYYIKLKHWAACKIQGMWRMRNARADIIQKKQRRAEQNSKIQMQLKRLKFRLLIKVLLALERHAIQCRRVKSLAVRCMQSSIRVFFDKLYHYFIWRRGLRIAAALLVQKRYRGWKGRILAFGYRNIAGANRLKRNEMIVSEALKMKRRRRYAHWVVAKWWRRSLLRWRAPMYLAWQRKFSATELQKIIRGYLGRGYAYRRWKSYTSACGTIQRYYRGYLGRKAAARQRTSIALQRAAILIQRAYRLKRDRDLRDEKMKKEILASIEMQRVYRGHGGRTISRERRWELHLEHLRSFAATVQRNVGLAPSGERNQKAMCAVRDLKKKIQTNQRKIRNRQAKMNYLKHLNELSKIKCGVVVQNLLDHRTRISSITEGIFQDSVKRSDLVDMHRYLKKHRDQLKKGLSSFHEALSKEAAIKQLVTPEEFDALLTKELGVKGPAVLVAPKTKLVTLPKSEWAKNREAARKRDEPPPDNELPLDDYGQKIRPPPPTSFMWPKMSAYYCPDKEKE